MAGDAGHAYDIEEPPWLWDDPARLSRPLTPPPPLAWCYRADPMLLLMALLPVFQVPAALSLVKDLL